MGVGKSPLAQKSGDNRNGHLFRHGSKFIPGAGENDTVTGHYDRPLGMIHQRCGRVKIFGIGGGYSLEAGQMNLRFHRRIDHGGGNIFGKINQYRAGAPRRGDVEGFFDHPGDVLRIGYHVRMLDSRQRHAHHVGFLKRV